MLTRRDFGKFAAAAALASSAHLSAQTQSSSNFAESVSPRRVGRRHNGVYWGHGPEKIDLLSGNLNLTVPLIHAHSRGLRAVAALSYNSQLGFGSASKTLWTAADLGTGFGWAIRIASIVPSAHEGSASGYTYVDAHGSEYALTKSGSQWVSLNGQYLTWNPATSTLKHADGNTLVFGCTSSAGEPDAGALHPTLIQDTNGNQIKVAYMAGSGSQGSNSSSRISAVSDARAVISGSRESYSFAYSNDRLPRLLSISSHVPTAESYTFSYGQQALSSPFGESGSEARTVTTLVSVTCISGQGNNFVYNSYGEVTAASLADGGALVWDYRTVQFGNGTAVREVSARTAMASAQTLSQKQTFGRGAYDQDVHSSAILTENNTSSTRVWTFTADKGSPDCGLLASITSYSAGKPLRQETMSWDRTASGAPYLGLHTKVLDPGSSSQQTSRVSTTRDQFGNLLTHNIYDYDNPGSPAKTIAYTYLSDPAYVQQHILNRVVSKKVTDRQNSILLIETKYDTNPLSSSDPVTHHDVSTFSTGYTVRGNRSEKIISGITHRVFHDQTGTVTSLEDSSGSSIRFTPAPGTNNTRVGSVVPNGDTSRASTTVYNASGLPVTHTGANGMQMQQTYDSLGRLTSTTNQAGTVASITYGVSPTTVTRSINGRWTRKTKDGFGRVLTTEHGDSTGTLKVTQVEYAPVPHTTIGGLTRRSMVHAPDAEPTWISRQYDDLGRVAAHGSPSSPGVQTVQHAGNTRLVTDGAGKWKRLTHNAEGRLVKVTLPSPDGGAEQETHYTYDTFGKLSSVTMPRATGTQKRKFKYDANGRPVLRQHAESGVQKMTYASDGTLASKTDAKGQKEVYQRDALKRVISVTRYDSKGVAQPNESFKYSFDSNPFDSSFSQNAAGRLTSVTWGSASTLPGLFTEMYSYTPGGQIAAVRLRVNRGQNDVDLDLSCSYDDEGRPLTLNYPTGGPALQHTYDSLGQLVAVHSTTSPIVKDASYDAVGNLTALKLLASSDGQYMTENRTYDSRNRLTRIATGAESGDAADGVVPKVNLAYNYRDTDGLLQTETDNVEGVSTSYSYDVQNRLAGAASSDGSWGLAFEYDGFGNRVTQNITQGQAFEHNARYDPATNWMLDNGTTYDANGNITSLPYLQISYDTLNRIHALNSQVAGMESYGYNHRNMRMWTNTARKGEQLYFYAGNKVLALYGLSTDSTGQLVATFKSANIYFGNRIVKSRGDAVVIDRLGATRAWSSKAGGKVSKYLPFGEELKRTNDDIAKFGGYQRDDSGLDYAQNRYYNSSLGRFMTPDPYNRTSATSNPNSWNRYAFVGNNPINRIDADGLNDQSPQSSGSYSSTSVTGTSSDGSTYSVNQTGQTDANGNQIIIMNITCSAEEPLQVQTTATTDTVQFEAEAAGGALAFTVGEAIADNSVAIGLQGAMTFSEVSGIVVSDAALDAILVVTASTGWGLALVGAAVAGIAIYNWYEAGNH